MAGLNRKCIMLRERSQTGRHMIHSGKCKTMGRENRSVVTVGYGWGKGLTVKISKRIWGTKELPWVLIVVVDDDGTCLLKSTEVDT